MQKWQKDVIPTLKLLNTEGCEACAGGGWHCWGLALVSDPGVGSSLPELQAWQPFNSHPVMAQPQGEGGFPYSSAQYSQEASSAPGSQEVKANPCRLPA